MQPTSTASVAKAAPSMTVTKTTAASVPSGKSQKVDNSVDKKKRRKARKETWASYLYKGQ